jgi:hypothetical protein
MISGTLNISGTKYNDLDGDASIDAGEPGLAGVTIFIDINKNGTYDAGTDEATTTDANGDWSFDDLDYTYAGLKVYEVVPSGYSQTIGIGGYTIVGTSGHDQTDLDFANHLSDPGSAMTPGFWKNHPTRFFLETGKTLNDKYEAVFGVDVVGSKKVSSDPTLGQALAAQGGGEAALLRASTAGWANATSDDLNYCFTDHDTILYGFLGSTGTDPLDPNLEAKLAAVIDQLEIIDLDDDGCLSAAEVIEVVQDVYDDSDASTNNWATNQKGTVAGLLDIMNNMPHIGANDFT